MEFVPIFPPATLDPILARTRLNIVVVSEGFVAGRRDAFIAVAQQLARHLLASKPFNRHARALSVSALWHPSVSGHTRSITDATRCDPQWLGQDTPFKARFCAGVDANNQPLHRLVKGDESAVIDAVLNHTPLVGMDWRAIVLVDCDQAWGGSGNAPVAWLSLSGDWLETAVHELGHSAFNLADEYDYDGPARHPAAEPSSPNVTTSASRDALKGQVSRTPETAAIYAWVEMMAASTPVPTSVPANTTCQSMADPTERQSTHPSVRSDAVGLFQGADHSPCDVHRPALRCTMRHHEDPFCPICDWEITRQLMRRRALFSRTVRQSYLGTWTTVASFLDVLNRHSQVQGAVYEFLYDASSGRYGFFQSAPTPVSAPLAQINPLPVWTSFVQCPMAADGLTCLLGHSAVTGRLGIFEVTITNDEPQLTPRLITTPAAPGLWLMAHFEWRGRPHVIRYDAVTGAFDISRIDVQAGAPVLTFVDGTASGSQPWPLGFTLFVSCRIDGVPYLVMHRGSTGEVEIRRLDPPATGPITFRSRAGHWNPPATTATAIVSHGTTFLIRTSALHYRAMDRLWSGGSGVEPVDREDRIDRTVAAATVRWARGEPDTAIVLDTSSTVEWLHLM